MITEIAVLNPTETSLFAAAELARCLRIMAKSATSFRVTTADALPKVGIALALADDPRVAGCCEAIIRSEADDAVSVALREGAGVIVGSNERSLLIGVYRLLHHLGCRWVRPGVEGEFLPSRDVSRLSATFVEKASVRHRVLCIEGAVSVENVLDMVDWAPKVGFSGYFIQFTDAYTFFNRWYSHAGNDSRAPEPFSKDAARAYTIRIEEALRKRALSYHSVGHGWTCQAIGVNATHWDPISVPLDDETRGLLAEVDGRRDLRWDRPMLTSLCFSQEEVKTRMVDAIAAHAAAHPEVDLLHVWVDDGGENKCECEACSQSLPADEYVAILQRLDATLTAAGSRMRIVFIAYTDLLWPPSKGTPPLNPERFAFLYANSRRDYTQTLQAQGPAAMPAYVRNHYEATNSPEAFRGYLQGWREYFPEGDRLLFEYYGCGPLNQYDLARVIQADAAALAPLGLNGLVNCQAQRVFFPVGLSCYVLGQTLWNTRQDLDALRDDYFLAAFGQDGGACKEFVKVSAEVLLRVARFKQNLEMQPDAPAQLEKLRRMITEFERVVARNAARPDPCQARSWYYMEGFARMLREMAGLFGVAATGDRTAVLDKWREVRRFLEELERNCQPVFDLWAFTRPYDRCFTEGRFSHAPQDVV